MIALAHLTKRYATKTAVDDLSVEVRAGMVTALLGPNGAGKSTSMRMLLGLTEPTSGSALINGCAYRDLRWPLREVGAALDATSCHPRRTARNHLLALAASTRVGAAQVEATLRRVGLTPAADQQAGTFSLGMTQRLNLAGALIGDPGVLVLDEPLTGLDPQGVRWMREFLHTMAGEGRTVLLSSHLLSEMSLTADRVLVLGQGRLLADSGLAEFVADHASAAQSVVGSADQARLATALSAEGAVVSGRPNGSLVVGVMSTKRIGEIALGCQIAIYELTASRSDLEGAFLRVTKDAVQFSSALPPQ